MKHLTREDLVDILTGSAILGTGGGGDIAEGLEYVDAALTAGKEIRLAKVEQLPKELLVCTPYLLGALVPSDGDNAADYARLPRSDAPAILTAFDRTQKYHNAKIGGMIPCELGGANTALAAYLAAMGDGVLLDADIAGRAVPEITHSTYYLNGLDAAPIVMANEFGECVICENVFDDLRAESIVRAFAKVSRNDVSVIDHVLPLGDVRHAIIPGTISKSLQLGQAFRAASESGADRAEAVAAAGDGQVVFRGVVGDVHFYDDDGFTLGEIVINGTDIDQKSTYKIGVKNENLVAWRDDVVHATIPELIVLIDQESNEPVTNPNVAKGIKAAVVILPAPKEFLSEKALAVFGPSYVGIDAPYRSAL